MDTEEILSNNNEVQKNELVSSSAMDSSDTPEIESEHEKTNGSPFKIPIITVDNKLIATLVEASDTEQSTDVDFTPTEEKSWVENNFTPREENLPLMHENVMDCDENNCTTVREPPNLIEFFIEKNVVELARCSWRGSSKNQRYLKGCLWSPDGTCLVTTVNGDGMHVFETPRDLYGADSVSSDRPLDCLQSAVHIKEGGIVYDYCWFPFMNSNDPATCW